MLVVRHTPQAQQDFAMQMVHRDSESRRKMARRMGVLSVVAFLCAAGLVVIVVVDWQERSMLGGAVFCLVLSFAAWNGRRVARTPLPEALPEIAFRIAADNICFAAVPQVRSRDLTWPLREVHAAVRPKWWILPERLVLRHGLRVRRYATSSLDVPAAVIVATIETGHPRADRLA